MLQVTQHGLLLQLDVELVEEPVSLALQLQRILDSHLDLVRNCLVKSRDGLKLSHIVMDACCNGCMLQWLHVAMVARCNGCTLQWMHAAMVACCNGCMLQWLHVAMVACCNGCMLQGMQRRLLHGASSRVCVRFIVWLRAASYSGMARHAHLKPQHQSTSAAYCMLQCCMLQVMPQTTASIHICCLLYCFRSVRLQD